MLQSLERRRLFSQLVVTGSALADSLDFAFGGTEAAPQVVVFNNGDNNISVTLDNTFMVIPGGGTFDTATVVTTTPLDGLSVALGAGGDAIGDDSRNQNFPLMGSPFPVTVSGGDGDDLFTGSLFDDQLDGGAGDDTIRGFDGSDLIFGGTGLDVLSANNVDNAQTQRDTDVDSIFAGDGDDTLYAGSSSLSFFRGENGNDTFFCRGGTRATLPTRTLGGPGVDTQHVIFGAGEAFTMADDMEALNVEIPDDVFAGRINGNALNNTIYVEGMASRFDPGDTIRPFASLNFTTISGGAGNDVIDVSALETFAGDAFVPFRDLDAARMIEGNAGDDTILVDAFGGPTFLRGGAGRDTLRTDIDQNTAGVQSSSVFVDYSDAAGPVTVTLDGVANDGPIGASAGETDFIGAGITNIRGSIFNDVLVGNAKNNVLDGSSGDDFIRGFDGEDYAVNTGRGRRGVRLLPPGYASRGQAERDRLFRDVEFLVGTRNNDTLFGNASANTIFGEGGNDYIDGQAGDDVLTGGDGADTLIGGDGVDTTQYDAARPAQRVTLDGVANDREPQANGKTARTENVMTENVENVGIVGGDAGPNRLLGVSVVALGGDGDDVIGLTGTAAAEGGAGNDFFINQNGAANVIDGGAGVDLFQDEINRLDQFTNVEFSYDRLPTGQTQNQKASLVSPPVSSRAALADAPATVNAYLDPRRPVLRIQGTAGADVIQITQDSRITVAVNDVIIQRFRARDVRSITIDADAGNDVVVLHGRRGASPVLIDSVLTGGAGDDSLVGGSGNDRISGYVGNDTIDGGDGNDILSGGFVVLDGETVPPTFTEIDGNDVITGGLGSSNVVTYLDRTEPITIDLRGTGKSFSGARGRDERDLITGVNYIIGGPRNDVITGSAFNDVLFGGRGNDTITGGGGADTLESGLDADSIIADGGRDSVVSGADDVVDRITGRLDSTGYRTTGATRAEIVGAFNRNDFFTLSGRRYGVAGS